MTIDLKVFEFLEDEGTEFESTPEYAVLYTHGGDWYAERYTIDAADGGHSVDVYPNEIDRYIEILIWMKEHQEQIHPAEPAEEPHEDQDVVLEEDG